jgi:hypothetical protein
MFSMSKPNGAKEKAQVKKVTQQRRPVSHKR